MKTSCRTKEAVYDAGNYRRIYSGVYDRSCMRSGNEEVKGGWE